MLHEQDAGWTPAATQAEVDRAVMDREGYHKVDFCTSLVFGTAQILPEKKGAGGFFSLFHCVEKPRSSLGPK